MLKIFEQHHKGLFLLFFVEMWERFSYYGMRALLVLYMVKELLFTTEKAGNIYGIYTGLVYLTPLLGGYLADRFFGQRKCITIGGILMGTGLFLLASGVRSLFLIALFFMIIGNGFFKSNISSILGILYSDEPDKKDSAFTIFYMGINLGAFFSPLVCGTIAYKFGFIYGFFSAGVGMLIGIIIYKIFENKYLNTAGLNPIATNNNNNIMKHSFTQEEKTNLFALVILMLFTVVFWTCYEQAGSSLTLFAEYSTNRNLFNIMIPTEYFQSLNPLFIIVLAPLMSYLWTKLNNKKLEPTSVEKFTIALFLISFAYIIMTISARISLHSLVSPLWLAGGYLVMTVAELCLSPIGLSLVTKLAPKQFLSLIMGTWFLTSFFGNMFAGFWGGKFGTISTVLLFFILAVISFISALILLLLKNKFNKILGNV